MEEVESIDALFNQLHALSIDEVIRDLSAYSDKEFKRLAIAVSKELNKRKNKWLNWLDGIEIM